MTMMMMMPQGFRTTIEHRQEKRRNINTLEKKAKKYRERNTSTVPFLLPEDVNASKSFDFILDSPDGHLTKDI